jgi:hypothetical protein
LVEIKGLLKALHGGGVLAAQAGNDAHQVMGPGQHRHLAQRLRDVQAVFAVA